MVAVHSILTVPHRALVADYAAFSAKQRSQPVTTLITENLLHCPVFHYRYGCVFQNGAFK
jgi:hypothetical protein